VCFSFLSVKDLLVMYVWFEATLPLLFLMIIISGERKVKLRASYMLFIYTLTFSMVSLSTVVFITLISGTTDLFELLLCDFSKFQQILILAGFLIAFAVKIPSSPFHTWLPSAHVEASTLGSILLAGIILKLGGYAIVRFVLPLCSYSYEMYVHYPMVFTYISILNTSLIILTEIDLKRIVAYFSIIHMNIALLALYGGDRPDIFGTLSGLISHSLTATSLFLSIGILYERYQIRDMSYYGGLFNAMPHFGICVFTFILSNFSFPLTFAFWPELLLLVGLSLGSLLDPTMILMSSISGVSSNLLIYTKVFFLGINLEQVWHEDLNYTELILLCVISYTNFFFGTFPNLYLRFFLQPINFLLTSLTLTI